jgi:hypothetical protein
MAQGDLAGKRGELMTDDEGSKLSRAQKVVLMLCYKYHPDPIDVEVLAKEIGDLGLLRMSEARFKDWCREVRRAKAH